MVHRQPLDDLADGLDDLGGLADINDGADDDVIIIPLVRLLIADVEQLIDDVGITLGQGVAYLGAGIFGGQEAAKLQQPVQGDPVPFIQVLRLLGDEGQLLLRVINQCRQLIAVMLGEGRGKEFVQLFPDDTGAGVEQMQKRLVFAVDIRDKVFRPLG